MAMCGAALFLLCLVVLARLQPIPDTVGFQIENVDEYVLMGQSAESAVYSLSILNANKTTSYDTAPYFVRLTGSRRQMGIDFATLVGDEVKAAYDTVLKNSGINFAERKLLESFADTQWNMYLSKQVPKQYMEELDGIHSVSRSVHQVVTRVFVLANLPSDLPEDMAPILANEGKNDMMSDELLSLLRKYKSHQCSMYAVWGSRTEGKQLFSCRNLDYTPDTGLNSWKSITLWIPNDGSIPHVGFGFLPLYGILSGMSKAGITVHEANLEEKNETFSGFPWVIRLRYIMENSKDLDQALELWNATNNTIGYNHMIAWQGGQQTLDHPAVAIETAAWYSAFFRDMDPREANCTHNGQVVGYPLPEALYRTNHPYDPLLMDDYLWWTYNAYTFSQQRYMVAHDTIFGYEESSTIIGPLQAINITANMADKGQNSLYKCIFPYSSEHGANVLSVTHQPRDHISYVAWDNGSGPTWRPACCNTYVKIDLTQWW